MWTPDNASLPLEEQMEAKDLPEEDRDEVRRFAEFLHRRSQVKRGETPLPVPEGMREWLIGEDG